MDDNHVLQEPQMVALVVGNASGSKLLQAFLDGHNEVISIPGYPLVYFYPHWNEWKNNFGGNWNWGIIVDLFIKKHSSIIDSRLLQGLDGLDTLGDSKDEFILVDKVKFKSILLEYLTKREISSRNFLFGVHYAYAISRGRDYKKIKVILYHIHLTEYVEKYLQSDFPDLKILGMSRKPCNNIYGRFKGSMWNVDISKFNLTDIMIYRSRTYYNSCRVIYGEIDKITMLNKTLDYKIVRHEDLGGRILKVMQGVSDFLGIKYQNTMLKMTFDNKKWWGVGVYEKGLKNKFNNEISRDTWKEKIYNNDCRVAEGVLYDYIKHYNYLPLHLFKKDDPYNRLLLVLSILAISKPEVEILKSILSPMEHVNFIRNSYKEIIGDVEVKDYNKNSSYKYRWCYVDYHLVDNQWYIFYFPSNKFVKQIGKSKIVVIFLYIPISYIRFILSILGFPLFIAYRQILQYKLLYKRIFSSNTFPKNII